MTDALIDRGDRAGDLPDEVAPDDDVAPGTAPGGPDDPGGPRRGLAGRLDRQRDRLRSLTLANWITFAVVAGCVVFVFWQFQPGNLFSDTTPTGGDMSAHVWGPAFLRDHLLPKGRLSGWSPDWYAGFPA